MDSKNKITSDLFIPTHVTDLFVRMDFVGHVPSGHKICVSNPNNRFYVNPQDRGTALFRWYYGENGSTTCDFIENIITDIYQLLRPENRLDVRLKDKIYEKASIFNDGVVNLINTYKTNPDASSKLRTSKEKLELKIPIKPVTPGLVQADSDDSL